MKTSPHKTAIFRVIEKIDRQDDALARREQELELELRGTQETRRRLRDEREIVQKAEEIQTRIFGRIPTDGQRRARIGNQRYAMLATLRDFGAMSPEALAGRTRLAPARVREQMCNDDPIYVRLMPGSSAEPARVYALTARGHELLILFETYRRSRGKPIPSLSSGGIATTETHSESCIKNDGVGSIDPIVTI